MNSWRARTSGIRYIEREAPHGEEDYYPDLIGCVAALKDVRALDALLGAITTGGMATRGIAALGESAVAPVLKRSGSGDMDTRVSALITLSDMLALEGPALSRTAVAAVRREFLRALEDLDHSVRAGALEGIANFRDAEASASIARIARSDPFSVVRAGRRVYPLRDEAKAYLASARTAAKP